MDDNTPGSRSCRRVPLDSDVNFQLKQWNVDFGFRISLDVDSGFVTRDSWILGRSGGARDPAEVVRERRQRLRHRLRRRLGHAMGRVRH